MKWSWFVQATSTPFLPKEKIWPSSTLPSPKKHWNICGPATSCIPTFISGRLIHCPTDWQFRTSSSNAFHRELKRPCASNGLTCNWTACCYLFSETSTIWSSFSKTDKILSRVFNFISEQHGLGFGK